MEVNPLDWTKIYLEGFTMVKFTAEQKLQALNLLKEVCSSCSLAQIIGTGSYQAIDTWDPQYRYFGVQGLEIWHTLQNYRGQFKLQVLNWRKEHDETYQELVTDISEFRYGNKSMSERLYFSPFKDLYSGEIVTPLVSGRRSSMFWKDLSRFWPSGLNYLTA